MSKKNDPLIAASNALGFQARKLRGAALASHESAPKPVPVPDVIEKLASLGEAQRADESAERLSRREAALAGADALIDRARAVLEEKRRLRAEFSPLISRLHALDWEAITKRAHVHVVPGSMETVVTRIGHLRRSVDEVWHALVVDTGKELQLRRELRRQRREARCVRDERPAESDGVRDARRLHRRPHEGHPRAARSDRGRSRCR
jgi:hypothetical protein